MKTDDHNKQLYRDMQEAPDKYSDQEIEAMMDDLDQVPMMDDLDQVPDADEAWQQFVQQHISSVRPMHTWRKVAAMVIGILTLSGIAIAAVHIVQHYQKPEAPQVAETTAVNSQLSTPNSQLEMSDTIVKSRPVVFDNVTLDSIAKNIATYHHLDMDLQNEQASQFRFYFVWDKEDRLQEVIEKLNMFEQVNLAVEDGKLIVR